MNKTEHIKLYLDFLWAMTEKEIKARYKKAVFGFLWVILNPILQMLIIGLIFSFFVRISNYFLFLFIGLLPWQFFSLSLIKGTTSFVDQRSLIQKSKFHREAIPISTILANYIHLLIALTLVVFFLLLTSHIRIIGILILIPTLLWLLTFTIGISLFTASLNVRFRDVNYFVQSIVILWFYATPIVYNLSVIPSKLRGLFNLNPLTAIFELFHFALLNQGEVSVRLLMTNLLISSAIIALGVVTYYKHHQDLADWI